MELFPKLGTVSIDDAILIRNDDEQTLTMYSGHPMGLFPSHKEVLKECDSTEW
jgi:hypothetical protein